MAAGTEQGNKAVPYAAFSLLLLSLMYAISLSVHLSAQRMMWADEFLAWNLLSDPSWHHALESWNCGTDSGGPLFYVLGRLILRVTGAHPLAIRVYSAGCVWLAAVLWCRLLWRNFGPRVAVFAVTVTWLCSTLFLFHVVEARFYGQFVLAMALNAVTAVWLEERQPPTMICFVAAALAGAVLVTTHMLGVIYSGAVLVALLGSSLAASKRIAAVAGTLASWGCLLFFLPALRSGAGALTWIQSATAMGVLRFYLHAPVYAFAAPRWSVLLNGILTVPVVVAAVVFLVPKRRQILHSRHRVLVRLSLLLLLAPLFLGMSGLVYKPLFAERYVLPYLMGYAALLACGLRLLASRLQPGVRSGAFALGLLLAAALHVCALLDLRRTAEPAQALQPLVQLSEALPVVLEEFGLQSQLRAYGHVAGDRFYVMVPEGVIVPGLIAANARQGYEPWLIPEKDFLQRHPHFYIVQTELADRWNVTRFLHDPAWKARPAGSVPVHGRASQVLEVSRR